MLVSAGRRTPTRTRWIPKESARASRAAESILARSVRGPHPRPRPQLPPSAPGVGEHLGAVSTDGRVLRSSSCVRRGALVETASRWWAADFCRRDCAAWWTPPPPRATMRQYIDVIAKRGSDIVAAPQAAPRLWAWAAPDDGTVRRSRLANALPPYSADPCCRIRAPVRVHPADARRPPRRPGAGPASMVSNGRRFVLTGNGVQGSYIPRQPQTATTGTTPRRGSMRLKYLLIPG